MEQLPKNFQRIKDRYGKVIALLDQARDEALKAGPLDEKTGHLVQLTACAAIRSEGGVHSHARRAMAAGATLDEIRHAVLLTIPTIGFPNVAAVLSWLEDMEEGK
ncbi:carboxymuconolactone decarboxylase family protein [Desulfocurvibacter africanus]|jgi:alkylhydroperoxidase/carboxymuconolactone decarboxylase family protein YurZ|uniref:Carboxymuconolactone decarboxylase n=2 Tax=Desulfocurvibacter africanus TaxID=873 RepID=F3Z2Y7_DESAF|nr:carboxymuconolactone decarboxylase family protein [Desulfocurvibacter africanus]EGJ51395.1 Carboxymuconolactone decarboxylase [Desulfocurvibacter africanus subsp. africanus str. Walvis Bay]EMG38773.1 putative protein, gamma-carboxymuconolactone decarboxylase subunit like protein [Desulfocurvibacter africanus PCS]